MPITRETIENRLTETLQAEDGAGSDLSTGERNGEWLEVLEYGAIDIEHLASEVIHMIEEAGGTVE